MQITSLDRRIARQAFGPDGDGTFEPDSRTPSISPGQRARRLFLAARIRTLTTLGLSEEVERGRWQIDPAFLSKLKAMQISHDRQKLIALGQRVDLDKRKSSGGQHPRNRPARDPSHTIVR